MFPLVHETSTDGIPTFWTDIDQTPKAIVTFGVGHRDEPPHLSGITEVAAQIVMSRMEPLAHSHTAVVGASVLTFTLVGSSADLPALVDQLCDCVLQLSHANADDIRLSTQLLVPDDESDPQLAFSSLLAYRFGYAGIGKSTAGPVGFRSLKPADLAAWSATYLHRDNVVLAFVGAAPGSTAARSLAHGPPRTVAAEQDGVDRPTILLSDRYELSFSLVSRPIVSSLVAGVVEYELMRELGGPKPVIRSADFELIDIDPSSTSIDVHLEPLRRASARALHGLVNRLWNLRVDGVSPAAMDHVRRDWDAAAANTTEVAESGLRAAAYGRLLSRPAHSAVAMQAAMDAATAESMTYLLREALPGLVIAVSADVDLDSADLDLDPFGVDDAHIWRPHASRGSRSSVRWKAHRHHWGRRRTGSLSVDGSRLSVGRPHGEAEIRFADVIAVSVHECGWLLLTDHRGRTGIVDPADFRGGSSIAAEIAGRLPAGTFRIQPAQ